MSAEEIHAKFPGPRRPQHVYGNDDRNITIALTLSSTASPAQLPEIKKFFEAMLPKALPALKWRDREMVKLDGRDWIHLGMHTAAIDTTIENDMDITSFDGKLLLINMNSTVAQYARAKPVFDAARDSIRLAR